MTTVPPTVFRLAGRLPAGLLLLAAGCAGPRAALQLSPAGHGHPYGRPGPEPVAWRAVGLAAPCALECRDRGHGGLGCACAGKDTIYLEHLQPAAEARAEADEGLPGSPRFETWRDGPERGQP